MSTVLAAADDAVTELGASPALPRIAAAAAQALGRLYGACGPLPLTLGGQAWQLEWNAAPPRIVQRENFGFKLGPHEGVVGIDAVAVASLAKERELHRLPRELRCVLWADAMHGVGEALERLTRLRFEWMLPEASLDTAQPQSHAARFELQRLDAAESFGGFVQFAQADALDGLLAGLVLPPSTARASLDALRIRLPFSLGRTQIALRELAAVRPGDIVAIEEWGSSGAALAVSADLGRAGLRLTGLAEGSRITLHPTKDLTMNRDLPDNGLVPEDPDAAALPLDRLDALEVSLRFEVGDLSLSLGELKSIRPGHVFDLGQPLNRSPVRILAHGNVLGKGHLVAVGDRLGVRVSEFAPGEIQ